jgi:hypothetical protein
MELMGAANLMVEYLLPDVILTQRSGWVQGAPEYVERNQADLAITKSLRLASCVAALSVQSKSSVQPFSVLCGPCGLPALT